MSSEIGVDPAVLTPRGSKFDLTLVLWESEDGDVGGIIEYATDLFEPDTIERFFRHFATLLEGITSNPLQHLSDSADAERGGTPAGDHRLECDSPRLIRSVACTNCSPNKRSVRRDAVALIFK